MNVVQLLGYQPTLYDCDGHGKEPGNETPGKRTPKLPNGQVILENQFNSPTAKFFKELALAIGFRVVETAPTDKDTPLSDRVKLANDDFKKQQAKYPGVPKEKLGLYISFHFNAGSGILNSNKGGVETYHAPGSVHGKRLADAIQAELVKGTKQVNRGVKTNAFTVLTDTVPIAALIEAGFMDNLTEALLMLAPEFQLEVATETLRGICAYYGLAYSVDAPKTGRAILGAATATVGQAQEWARANKAPDKFIELAANYWRLAAKRGGVDPAVAYVQFAHETGFLYRDGKSSAGIDASYCNPCGLKITTGGGDYQASAHKRFATWDEGITAHLDHLALYAGAKGYPLAGTPDPRHFPYLAGKATTVEALGGKWAPSATYGDKLVTWVKALEKTAEPAAPEPEPVKDWKQLGLEWLQDNLRVEDSWKPTDVPDMGTLGTILQRFANKLEGKEE